MTDENTPVEEPAAAPPPLDTAPPPLDAADATPQTAEDASTANRVLAVIIDFLIAGALGFVPAVGYLAGLAYMVTRDALPFLDGQSVGKKAMKLRAVNAETGAALTNDWGPCVIRNVVLYIPFFAIVELIVLANNANHQRLGDQWAKTRVVVEG